mgnify:CR=1 FL=1
MQTRGGQGTAENIINSTNPLFYEPHLWVLKDIHPDTARYLQQQFREMDKERHSNKSLEAAKKDSPPSKKRVTASEVMSEQQMFQEEHLKLVERVNLIEARQRKIIRVLHALDQKFQEHVSLDSPGATLAQSTTSSLGTGSQPCLDDACLACNKLVRDCKCFDD